MDPVAITALILSIISILLWAYTYMSPKKTGNDASNSVKSDPAKEEPSGDVSMPVPVGHNIPAPARGQETQESRFMSDTQKFSQMVRKNLEMLNTRVGIKFDVKPLSEDYSVKKKGPNYIDSMDVTEERSENYLTDESEKSD